MLCQLVCIDRRYQRMNCFNIREVESLLKRRFFTDLINSRDHHTLLDKTAIGLRYKIGSDSNLNNNIELAYSYGLNFTPQTRSAKYLNFFKPSIEINDLDNLETLSTNSNLFVLVNYFDIINIFYVPNTIAT